MFSVNARLSMSRRHEYTRRPRAACRTEYANPQEIGWSGAAASSDTAGKVVALSRLIHFSD
jgi:hypothetical protein